MQHKCSIDKKGKDYGKDNRIMESSDEAVNRNIERIFDSYEETARMRASSSDIEEGDVTRKRCGDRGIRDSRNTGRALRHSRVETEDDNWGKLGLIEIRLELFNVRTSLQKPLVPL